MIRTLAVAGAVVVLGVGVALAARSEKAPRHAVEEVTDAFSRQGIVLAEAEVSDHTTTAVSSGWTDESSGRFVFPAEQDFYVFVAKNDALARVFFEALAQHPGAGSGTFDMRRGNVVVSSDASFTETGLQWDRRQRIRVAMDSLEWDRPSFEDAFDRVEIGMYAGQVLGLLGRPVEQLGPGGTYPPPLENTPTRIWYYGPNITHEGSNEPLWTVGFRDGKVLTLKEPEV